MSSYKRFLIGGIGGLAPVLMFLMAVDFERYIVEATTLKMLGYFIRVVVLFFVGGFVAYLHDDDVKPFKLFEVGLGAPALIAGYITTSLVPATAPVAANPAAHSNFSIVSAAYAQPRPAPDEVKRFSLPVQSPADQFFQGLIGGTPKKVWFVIVGSHLHLGDATKQARQINGKLRDYKADVYAPYGDNPYYAVVIGANLTQEEAKALRDKAIKSGLPKDSYYKTFPNLPPPAQP
jgi:hypothetical protein